MKRSLKKSIVAVLIVLLILSSLLCGCVQPAEPDNTGGDPSTGGNTGAQEKPEEVTEVAPRRSFKILAVGNSFSDNAMNYMYPILDAFGVQEIVIGNLYIGGCTLETHVNNALSNATAYTYRKNTEGTFVNTTGTRMSAGLKDEDWQYVTMQQASGYSGVIDTYNKQLGALNDYIRDIVTNKDVKIGWHMTWAYQQNATHSDFPKYENSQSKMYQDILNCVQTKIEGNSAFDFVIPAGTAIQNARTSYLGDTLTADGYHLDGLGELIIGLTWIKTITNWDLSDMNVDKLPRQFMYDYDVIIESVENAVKTPYAVTQSKYSTDPNVTPTGKYTTQTVQYSEPSACKLDMYLPQTEGFDTVVHFHGGGLNSGSRNDAAHVAIAKKVASSGVGFVSVDYRFLPVDVKDIFSDAAKAVKYVVDNIKQKGGSGKIYVSGQSAGAYISLMLAFNKDYLAAVGMTPNDITGWIIEGGQPTTHFNVLAEQGLDSQLQRIDENAPMYYIDRSTKFKKMLLITYTNDITCRLEHNKLLYATLKNFNANANVELRVYHGNHCVLSTTAFRGRYAYADIVLEYVLGK